MNERSLLLVAQLAPPSPLVAARRVAGLSKYLARLGYRITVLTSRISGDGPIEGAAEVVRTADLMGSPLNWRRRHFAALTGQAAQAYARPSRLEAVVVPDLAALSWIPPALPRALALSRKQDYDCVITSAPPSSAHLIGRTLRRRGVCWLAELRDGWTFEPPRPPWPLAVQRVADRRLERALLRRADAVVGVTKPIVDDARQRLGVDARMITNGFDPEEHVSPRGGDLLARDRHSVVHTGRMALARTTPRPLLDALRLLQRKEPSIARRLEVVFAGPVSSEEEAALAAPDLAGIVRVLGPLERERALRLQRAADTLLVVTEGGSRPSVATGKIFEYLAAGRPILVLGEGTEAARIVAEARAGLAAPADDAEAIAATLRRLVDQPLAAVADESVVERYTYAEIARAYADLIEEICARAGR